MKQMLGVAGTVMVLAGCGLKQQVVIPEESPVDTSGVLRLVGRFNLCHACPVSEHDALTAAHCVDLRPFDPAVPLYPMAWSDGMGHDGLLMPVGTMKDRDLAQVYSPTPFPQFYERAEKAPQIGDEVVVLGYKWKRKDPWGSKTVRAKVTGIVGGHFTIDENPDSGSSGGCVLDAKTGKILGIEHWGFHLDDGEAGAAVGVWGDWVKITKVTAIE